MSRAILFNITFKLASNDAEAWIELLRSELLPACTDGTDVIASQINRILTGEQDDDETYAVQFSFASIDVFRDKKLAVMKFFLDKMDEQFRCRYVYFGTIMELIHKES